MIAFCKKKNYPPEKRWLNGKKTQSAGFKKQANVKKMQEHSHQLTYPQMHGAGRKREKLKTLA